MSALKFSTSILAALVLAACGARDFGAMSQERRLAVGSALLVQACMNSGNPHDPGFFGRLEIARGREYFDYVTANVRPGELDQYIDEHALEACLETEGWRRDLRQLIFKVGSDLHVEAVVQSVASPDLWCDFDFTRDREPHEAGRIIAACDRLGLRQISP